MGLTYLKNKRKDQYESTNKTVEKQNTLDTGTTLVAEPTQVAKEVIESPMPGNILKVNVKVGDKVEKGETILILEAMKMENDIIAEVSGTVSKILVEESSFVQTGSPMVELI